MRDLGEYAAHFARLYAEGAALPVGEAPEVPALPEDAPVVLVFAPHPDDEVLLGTLPLRLLREGGMRVIAVAVTLGSDPNRREARRAEMRASSEHLGFGLEIPCGGEGLGNVHLQSRRDHPREWLKGADSLGELIEKWRPRCVVLPHSSDGHPVHIATHFLVRHALLRCPPQRGCYLFEGEYWAPMERPNLLVEAAAADVGHLVGALACHKGEVARNAYHLRLPAWLMDNVRRAPELIGGYGSTAPGFPFGQLYRMGLWAGREWQAVPPVVPFLSAEDSILNLFPEV